MRTPLPLSGRGSGRSARRHPWRAASAILLALCLSLFTAGLARAQAGLHSDGATDPALGERDSVAALRTLGEAASAGRVPGGLRAAIGYWRAALALERATRTDRHRISLLRQLGEAYDELALGDSARASYEAALARTVSAAAPATPAERADALIAAALPVYGELLTPDGGAARLALGETRLREAEAIAEQLRDQPLLARVQLASAKLRLVQRDVGGSARLFESASRSARQAGDALTEARALALLGNQVAVVRRDLDGAMVLLERARARAIDAGVPRLAIEIDGRIGALLGYLGRRDEGLSRLRAAVQAAVVADDPVSEGTWQSYVAFLLLEAGRPEAAIAAWRRSNRLLEQAGATSGISYGNVATAFSRTGQPDSAIQYARRALQVAQRQQIAEQEAAAATQLAGLYRSLRRPDSVRVFEAVARDARGRSGVPAGAHVGRLVVHAEAALADGDSAAALATLREGRRLVAAADRVRESVEAESRSTILRIAMELHLSRAEPDTASAIGRAWEDGARGPIDSLDALLWSGVALAQAGRTDAALEALTVGLLRARALRDVAREQTALLLMARAYAGVALEATGSGIAGASDARHAAATASALFDSVTVLAGQERRAAGGRENRIGAAESVHEDGTLWTAMRLALDDEHGALAVSDRFRARDLLEAARRESGEARDSGGWLGDPADAGRRLAGAVAAGKRAFLSYHIADDGLWVWLGLADGSLRHATVRVTQDWLTALVAGLRASLADGDGTTVAARAARWETPDSGRVTASDLAAIRPARWLALLGDVLVPAELRRLLPARGELVVVPHGVLGLVPFAALPIDARGYPLGARYALRFAPSLALAAEQATGAEEGWRARLSASLVIGNPAMPRVVSQDGYATTLPPLPAAEREAARVAATLGAPVLSGIAASETVVRRRLAAAPIVHLATHGMAYAVLERSGESFVALAPGDGHDGRLTLAEIERDDSLSVRAELVALSACETGFGDVRFAEGTIGLQRAFLGRGARRVLATLWSVDDAATALLMERFYAHWLRDADGPAPAEALRRAVVDLRQRAPQYADPFYWAGVQLVGQP